MAAPLGNQNGKKGKRWQDALMKALARYANPEKQIEAGQALDRIAENVVASAIAGDTSAIAEIGNRLDGKPAQSLTVGGDDDAPPVKFKGVIELVRPG
jgi:hypothetical protein